MIGLPAERVLAGWPEVLQRHSGREGARSELAVTGETGTRYYDLRSSPLFGHAATLTGRLFVLRDITDRKRAEQAEQEQRALAEALRDAASSLASTLDFDAVLDRILAAAARVVPYDCGDVLLIEGDIARRVRVQDHIGHGLPVSGSGAILSIPDTPNLKFMLETGRRLRSRTPVAFRAGLCSLTPYLHFRTSAHPSGSGERPPAFCASAA